MKSTSYFLFYFWTVLNSFQVNSIADVYYNGNCTESPKVTDWGVWGEWHVCPLGWVVVGVQTNCESSQTIFGDDTALNGIKCSCADKKSKNEWQQPFFTITSDYAPWGSGWSDPIFCQWPAYVVGFQMKSEENQGSYDDTAANGIKLMCSDGTWLVPPEQKWGDWTPVQVCDQGQGVCGIQTQVEPDQGSGDDTALNNVRLGCIQY